MLHQPLPPVNFMMISMSAVTSNWEFLRLCQTSNNSIWMLKIFHQFKICLLWVQGCYISMDLGPRAQYCRLVVFMLNVLNYCYKNLFSAPVRLYYIFSLRGLVDFVSTLPIILYWRSVTIILSTTPKLYSCT